METVTIVLTTIEANKFKTFQKYYWLFDAMLDKGVFDMEFGKVTINIANSQVQNLVKEEMVWRK